ncbi:hypothetical protein [Streptomyces sp. NPDC059513]|uniref:hypothetical protein n=1 Tax=unclassified Streptomyces TaxID=2593676 RepID=UPI0036752681
MPRTLTALPADRFMAVVTGILGTEWTPSASPGWPLTFTDQDGNRQLTVYPEPLNNRLTLVVAAADDPDDFNQQRLGRYTPNLNGYASMGAWLADGDLDDVADALAVVVRRLIDQPLPEPVAPHPDPVGRELEQLAQHARELARLTAQFAAGLIRGEPVADKAARITHLAQLTEQSATRVDELRGPAAAGTAGRL